MKNTKNLSAHRAVIRQGIKDGIPIGLGYFAVSFSLGIAAKRAGLTALQGFITSALVNASAGEYAGFKFIEENATYVAAAIMTLVANARYFLMSCALSQKVTPETPLRHRILLGFYITDEFFGITIARKEFDPFYTYGAVMFAAPCWALGTACGILAGSVLPVSIVSALSVTLYGMFLAIIIPPSRKNKIVGLFVLIGFALSFAASRLPFLNGISDGTKTIVLTLVISAAAALLFPVKEDEHDA
ncbi:MAG TPA: branched-chain amino acid ABC transporter permease [Ruminococcaceae bacterium]|nr:branched-chain amino acid ABC transporter permease [Oscillospiraceae bacterium]